MLSAAKSRGAGTPPWMSQEQRQQEEGNEKRPLKQQDDRQPAEDVNHKGLDMEAGGAAAAAVALPDRRMCNMPVQVLAGLSYCGASASMVLLNKFALSAFDFHSITMLLLFQCVFCVTAVQISALLGLVKLEGWNWKIARTWVPANCVFVCMIWTSFPALQLLGVAMVTVLKNLANLFTIAGDIIFFDKRYGAGVWATLGLMTLSALCGALTDLHFNWKGYVWQLTNCLFTAGYSLTLRGVMDRVAPLTKNQRKLDEFSMVLYNNLLSIPMLMVVASINGEFATILHEPALHNRRFQAAAMLSAICGFLISFCSLWFLSTTTATTYSLVGSLNKMPIAIMGLLFFDPSWSAKNVASVLVGLVAGVVFVRAKQTSSGKT